MINPETSHLVLIETDHNAYTEETKQQRKLQMADEMREAAGEDEMDLANEMAEVIRVPIVFWLIYNWVLGCVLEIFRNF